MEKKKVVLLAVLASLLVCGVAVLLVFTIGKNNNGVGGGQRVEYTQAEEEVTLTVPTAERLMTIGDTYLLQPTYTKTSGYTLKFVSNNASVASVDVTNGLITALNEGTATVSAIYSNGTKTVQAQMTVSCGFGEYKPYAQLSNVTDDGVSVIVGNDLQLNSYVSFNGLTFDDGSFSYSIADNTVATVTDGTLNALKKGETSLIINGTWRGKTLTESVSVTVKDEVIFLNNGKPFGDELIYTVNKAPDGKTYPNSMPNKFTIKVNGKESSAKAEIANKAVATASGSTIKPTAGGFGTTAVTVSTKDGAYSKTFMLTVERPVVTIKDTVPMFATDYGYFLDKNDDPAALLSFANDDTDLVDAYQGKRPLNIVKSNGYIFGIESKDTSARSEVKITAGTATVKYDFTVEVVAKFFKTKEDLLNLCSKAGDAASGGYFELLNNIDANGITMSHSSSGGFKGTFNGGGYTISNLKMGQSQSFFGTILEGATITNLGLKNLNATKAYYMFQSGIESGWSMENIYISLSADTQSPMGFGSYAGSGNVMKNVVVEYLGDNASANRSYDISDYQGSFMSGLGRFDDSEVKGKYVTRGTYENVYVISPFVLSFKIDDGFAPGQNKNRPSPQAAIYAYADNEENDLYGNPTNNGENNRDPSTVTSRTVNELYFNVVFKGVKRYDTVDAFKAAKENHSLSEFNSAYWTVGKDGSLVWKTAA